MKLLLLLEEIAMFGLGIWGLSQMNVELSWWAWLLLFFAPDIGMIGYAVNAKVGAFTYNLFHHKGIALLCLAAGYWLPDSWLMTAGCLLFAHSSFDRIFGYGLKYSDAFKHTHLGWMK